MLYLTVDDVAQMNAWFVGEACRSTSDCSSPRSSVRRRALGGADAYPTIHDKDAALLHSLIRNHPFMDANKRTAVSAVFVFYRLNGRRLTLEDGELVALAVDVAEGILPVEAIAKRLAHGSVDDEPPL